MTEEDEPEATQAPKKPRCKSKSAGKKKGSASIPASSSAPQSSNTSTAVSAASSYASDRSTELGVPKRPIALESSFGKDIRGSLSGPKSKATLQSKTSAKDVVSRDKGKQRERETETETTISMVQVEASEALKHSESVFTDESIWEDLFGDESMPEGSVGDESATLPPSTPEPTRPPTPVDKTPRAQPSSSSAMAYGGMDDESNADSLTQNSVFPTPTGEPLESSSSRKRLDPPSPEAAAKTRKNPSKRSKASVRAYRPTALEDAGTHAVTFAKSGRRRHAT